MVTAIFKEDVTKFIDLAPEGEWKTLLTKNCHAIGSIMEVEDGYAATGVMIYKVENVAEITGWEPFINIRWVYASMICKDALPVYKELFTEMDKICKNLSAHLITMVIPRLADYNYKELAGFLLENGYILFPGRDGEMYACKFPKSSLA